MSLRMNPYFVFSGNAREAMTFYQEVFGGELSIRTFGDFDAAPDEASQDLVMHAQLAMPNGMLLLASDGGSMYPSVEGVGVPSLEVAFLGLPEDEDEVRVWFDRLAEDGEVRMNLEKAMWGDVFGSLKDKFGIQWLVNLTAPQNQ